MKICLLSQISLAIFAGTSSKSIGIHPHRPNIKRMKIDRKMKNQHAHSVQRINHLYYIILTFSKLSRMHYRKQDSLTGCT